MYLNQKLVSSQNNTYPYCTYLENMLNYDSYAKYSHPPNALYFKDTAGNMDDCEEENYGLVKRRLFVKDKYIDMIGQLHLNLRNEERFLLNGVELRLHVFRSRNTFSIMSK